MELLTAAQMRRIETSAFESGTVSGLELMERAGLGVVEAVFEEWPEFERPSPVDASSREYLGQEEARRAVVLCGPGNNGGDGYVVARLLHQRGWRVEVLVWGDPGRLPPDAAVNFERWRALGDWAAMSREGAARCAAADLVVDAVFGIGLARPVTGALGEMLDGVGKLVGPRLVCVDVPSGLDADCGIVPEGGACIKADLTVTFHAMKLGHVLEQGPEQCGKVVVKSIGLDPVAETGAVGLVDRDRVFCDAGIDLAKSRKGHKYAHGHALVVSGGFGKTGAARLAAMGALRSGPGLVTLAVPGAAQMEVASQITALMMRRAEDGRDLADLLADERLTALCLGPGLGLERARELVPVVLGQGGAKPRPTVLDADALTAFSEAPETLFAGLHAACVLTPHGGEFARLFPDIAKRLAQGALGEGAFSKVDAARLAAERAGCVVLFKGADTVIAAPDGRCAVHAAANERAAPWLATAGAGDVLAGIITGLLARGFAPMSAAEAGAWLHVEAARAFGPGLIAEDLPDLLPQVFRQLLC